MVLNLGAFYQGVQENDARERAKRKENAALYNEYVRLNPDSTVKQREAYANQLGENSPFLRAAMPTTDVMKSNVARRRQQVAAAAQAKKYKAMQQKMQLMNDATTMFSNVYSATGDKGQASSAVSDMFSGFLDAKDMVGISASGTKKAQQDFDRDFATTWDLWNKTGSQASGIEAWKKTYNPTFLRKWETAATGVLETLKKNQFDKAMAEAQSDLSKKSAADPSIKENFFNNFNTKYDRLNDEDKTKIEDAWKGGEEFGRTALENSRKAARSAVIDQITNTTTEDGGMKTYNLMTDEAIKDMLKSGYNLDPNIANKEPTAEEIAEVRKAVEEATKIRVSHADAEESKLEAQALDIQETDRQVPLFVDSKGDTNVSLKEFNEQTDQQLKVLYPEVDGKDKEEAANLANQKQKFTNNFMRMASEFDINIKDPLAYQSILKMTVEKTVADSGQGADFDAHHFILAVSEYYQNEGVQSPEAKMFRKTLSDMGAESLINILEASNDNPQVIEQWQRAYSNNRAASRKMAFDNIDKEINTLQSLDDEVNEFISKIDGRVGTARSDNANDALAQDVLLTTQKLIEADITVPGVLNDIKIKDGQVTNSMKKLAEIGRDIEDQLNQIKAYVALPMFSNDPSLGSTRENLKAKVAQLNDKMKTVYDNLKQLESVKNALNSKSQSAMSTKILQNENLSKEGTPEVVKQKTAVIADDIRNNAQQSGLDKVSTMTYSQKIDWLKGMLEKAGEKFRGSLNFWSDRSDEDALIKELADSLGIDLTPPPTALETELENFKVQEEFNDQFGNPNVTDDLIKLPQSFDR